MNSHDSGPHSRFGTTPLLRALVAFGALCSTSCAMGIFADPSGFDSQACVERSLRAGTDAQTSTDAAALFRDACAHGDAGGCSALGVIHEVGLTGPKNAALAAAHYRRACELGNRQGCQNLETLANSAYRSADYAAARVLFARACDAKKGVGCPSLTALPDPSTKRREASGALAESPSE
jgi:TPR repeat protein